MQSRARKPGPFATHEVRNQARPPLGFNAFDGDRALSGLVAKIAPWAKDKLSALGAHAGCESVQEAARLANEHEPKLLTHDRYGNRNDWVEFHPAWHQLMALAFQSEVHSLAWSTREPNGHFARAALSYLWNQIENGVGCPTGMAYAAIAGFSGKPQFATWRERTLAADYDPRRLPIEAKRAAVIGYAMTEKQGGSDLRETQTTARFVETRRAWRDLCDHRPQMVLFRAGGRRVLHAGADRIRRQLPVRAAPAARRQRQPRLHSAAEGQVRQPLECFERDRVPRHLVDPRRRRGARHQGNSLACAPDQAGFRGRLRRTDAAGLEPGIEPRANANRRSASRCPSFRCRRNVLADLALESEAAMLGALRVARATDGMETSEHERLLARVATPVVKFWNCQRAPAFSYECLQVHGGNGFIMENAMARLYREAPLNSIWEGTSNMMCMDVLRAMQRDASCRDAFIDELRTSRGLSRIYDRSTEDLADRLRAQYPDDGHARALVTRMAHALQAAEMLQHGDADAADLFVRSRLGMDGMHVFGALPSSEGFARIVERASVISH